MLEIFNADGGGLNGNDDNGPNPDSRIAGFNIPADGEYYLRVRDQLARGAADFVYRVEVSPPTASLKAYITRFDRVDSQMRQLVPLPRGGRYAALVNVDRANCGGPIAWDTASLPAGVALEYDPMPDGITQQALLSPPPPMPARHGPGQSHAENRPARPDVPRQICPKSGAGPRRAQPNPLRHLRPDHRADRRHG